MISLTEVRDAQVVQLLRTSQDRPSAMALRTNAVVRSALEESLQLYTEGLTAKGRLEAAVLEKRAHILDLKRTRDEKRRAYAEEIQSLQNVYEELTARKAAIPREQRTRLQHIRPEFLANTERLKEETKQLVCQQITIYEEQRGAISSRILNETLERYRIAIKNVEKARDRLVAKWGDTLTAVHFRETRIAEARSLFRGFRIKDRPLK